MASLNNSSSSEDRRSSPEIVSSTSESRSTGIGPTKHPAQVARRNARERRRVQAVNSGFVQLRDRLPASGKGKKLSKVETLRTAARYIRQLQELLTNAEPGNFGISTFDESGAASPSSWGYNADMLDFSLNPQSPADTVWNQNNSPYIGRENGIGSSPAGCTSCLPGSGSIQTQQQQYALPFTFVNANVSSATNFDFATMSMMRDLCSYF